MISEPLTEDPGLQQGPLTLLREGSPVGTSQSVEEGQGWKGKTLGSGPKCYGLSLRYDPLTSSWRTPQLCLAGGYQRYAGPFPAWATVTRMELYQQPALELPISGKDSGLLPTLTADDTGHRKRKYQQGGSALSLVVGGPLSPTWLDWMMGFPIGYSALKPLEGPRFQQWLRSHFPCFTKG